MGVWNKWIYWLVFAVCIWTLLAAVFLIDRHSFYSSDVMIARIWQTTGDVILLSWVEKYQTLLAGLAAVTGGLATFYAATLSLSSSREAARQQQQFIIVANASYLSEMFRQFSLSTRSDALAEEVSRWERVSDKINAISPCYPKFAQDLIYLWNRIRFYSDKNPTPFALSNITTTAYIAKLVLDDIVNYYHCGGEHYKAKRILASEELIEVLNEEDRFIKSKLENANIIGLIRPFDQYIDFAGTDYYNV